MVRSIRRNRRVSSRKNSRNVNRNSKRSSRRVSSRVSRKSLKMRSRKSNRSSYRKNQRGGGYDSKYISLYTTLLQKQRFHSTINEFKININNPTIISLTETFINNYNTIPNQPTEKLILYTDPITKLINAMDEIQKSSDIYIQY